MTETSPSVSLAELHAEQLFAKLQQENQVLRELLDLFEHYCEFRLGVQHAIKAKDIPNMRDINKARKLLGLKEIATRSPA
jgi:hypothetical protein